MMRFIEVYFFLLVPLLVFKQLKKLAQLSQLSLVTVLSAFLMWTLGMRKEGYW